MARGQSFGLSATARLALVQRLARRREGQEAQADYKRGQALAGDRPGVVQEVDRYDGAVGRTTVLWGGIANFSSLGIQIGGEGFPLR